MVVVFGRVGTIISDTISVATWVSLSPRNAKGTSCGISYQDYLCKVFDTHRDG